MVKDLNQEMKLLGTLMDKMKNLVSLLLNLLVMFDVWLIKPYDNDELVFVRESDMEAYYWV